MSAIISSHGQINAMVTFWRKHCTYGRTPTTQECQQVGERLLEQNIASYNHLYPHDRKEMDESYFFYTLYRQFTPIQMFKLIRFYQYQSDNNEGFEESDGWKLSQTMSEQAISMLPGYEQADWGI